MSSTYGEYRIMLSVWINDRKRNWILRSQEFKIKILSLNLQQLEYPIQLKDNNPLDRLQLLQQYYQIYDLNQPIISKERDFC